MSFIDASAITSDAEYDANLADLPGRLAASRPRVLQPEPFSRTILARLALCMAAGVPVDGSGTRVLGSAEWEEGFAPDLSDFPETLPSRASLSVDGLGLIEWHGPLKVCTRQCKNPGCNATFVQKRGGRAKARWNEVCSSECRKVWRNMRDRAVYAAKD